MTRRDKAGGKAVKTQRPKTLRRNGAKAARRRSSPATRKEINVAQVIRERDEAQEQLAATSEVLSIISTSAGELQPVFETMLAKATALCEASYGTMWLREGDAFRAGSIHGALPEAFLQLHRTRNLYRAGPGMPAYEAIINRQTCAVADLRET